MKYITGLLLLGILFGCDNVASTKNNETATSVKDDKVSDKDLTQPTISSDAKLANFVYNPNAGEYKASTKSLSMADVENLMKNELEIMRNEIFARHGYMFPNNKALLEYFQKQDWYVGITNNVKPQLTPSEKQNIGLIKRFENYADEHGDDFGR